MSETCGSGLPELDPHVYLLTHKRNTPAQRRHIVENALQTVAWWADFAHSRHRIFPDRAASLTMEPGDIDGWDEDQWAADRAALLRDINRPVREWDGGTLPHDEPEPLLVELPEPEQPSLIRWPRRRSPEPIELPEHISHGEWRGYQCGCGCDPCRSAHRQHRADVKAESERYRQMRRRAYLDRRAREDEQENIDRRFARVRHQQLVPPTQSPEEAAFRAANLEELLDMTPSEGVQ